MLDVSNLRFNRGGRELFSDLSFSLDRGECLQIVGVNGSGKSSLASLIAEDLTPASGTITFDGRSGLSPKELSGIRGVLPQDLAIEFPLQVSEFITMPNPVADIKEITHALNLRSILNRKITEISLGQLQRVEIAQLVIQNPDLFILDEPFSAQDSQNTALIIDELKNLKSKSKAIIIINHHQVDLLGLVDHSLTLG